MRERGARALGRGNGVWGLNVSIVLMPGYYIMLILIKFLPLAECIRYQIPPIVFLPRDVPDPIPLIKFPAPLSPHHLIHLTANSKSKTQLPPSHSLPIPRFLFLPLLPPALLLNSLTIPKPIQKRTRRSIPKP